jgi:hypothetical protein
VSAHQIDEAAFGQTQKRETYRQFFKCMQKYSHSFATYTY